ENRVLQMTTTAREAYVEFGMTPTQAMARCQKIILRARSPHQEDAAQKALLQCASTFSPFLESTAPGVCTINLRGLSEFALPSGQTELPLELSDRAHAWANRVLTRVSGLQLHSQIGLAADPDVARLAAQQAQPILFVHNVADFLNTVPLHAAGLPPEILQVISKWGLNNIGQFRDLGHEQLASRFGDQIVEFLDRIAPPRPRPLKWVTPEIDFEESIELENPIESLEPLLFILRRFLDQLSHRLESVYLVAQELKLTLALESGAKYERAMAVPSPTRNINTLFRMLHTHLENLQTDAPIVGVTLRAEPARAQNHQFGLFQASLRDPNQFYETLARLEALLGPNRSGTPMNEASYKPDDFHIEPPRFHGQSVAEAPALKTAMGPSLRRFRPAIPAIIQLELSRPVHVQSERARGKITEANGPWRSSGNWWEEPWARDEWDVRLANGRAFRLVQQQNQWFIEGVFD
ncbi:MAG TPA: DNA polymerase Y family protein, partial [Verrucomicrobiae bacterium]